MNARKTGLFFVKQYLKGLVQLVIWRHKPTFVVVTGSAGKTTLKFLIYQVLKEKYGKKVAVSPGSLSTKTGIPIALLGFKPEWPNLGPSLWQWPWWLVKASLATSYWLLATRYPKLWVLEFAADLPGDFDFLLSYIKPKVAIVTNVGEAHLEFFKTIEGIAKEKGSIVAALPKDGLAVLNGNDRLVRKMGDRTSSKIVWIKAQGFRFNQEAARAVGRYFKVPAAAISRAIKSFEPPRGRFTVVRGKHGSTIIDSSYNANPVSMELALGELAKVKGRKVAVLGDMFELGAAARQAHRRVGETARQSANLVITVGPLAKRMGGKHFEDKEAAIDFLLQQVRKGDTILVKASHGMEFKEIVEALKK
ncbi:hypothetical protein HYZ64_00960 [Candidatus Berkelbacteria bacterium]|nr:hypothetical protein [Candidatus Berkelbacteria bacterium]